jgi:catechol 2,3-dioxygenase-like lactoylglutathione lyase family enzyme
MKRRKFVKNTISFTALILLHNQAQTLTQLTKNPIIVENCRFPEITLYTSKLKEQLHFYSKVLGIPVIDSDNNQFTLKIGASVLRFKEVKDGSNPTYHFAFNIPSNKFKKAEKWLSKKTPLLGGGLFYFDFWDAHAMYFTDPSGNIGELIARHTLDNDSDGEFDVSDLLCISEIGTPVENPSDFSSELKKVYNLDAYGESMFIGDENGLFVVVPVDRLWFPDYTLKAKIYPTDIVISDKGKEHFQYKNYPYNIN